MTIRTSSTFPPPRLAVSLLFMLNGFFLGNWAPKIPQLMARLDISTSTMGLLIFILGFGGICILPATSSLIQKVGSHTMSRLFCLVVCVCFMLISAAPTTSLVAIALFITGAALIGLDIAMNANVLVAEEATNKTFMSSSHGFWSLGGIAGGLSGGLMLESLGDWGHSLVVSLVSLLVLAYLWPRLAVDKPLNEDTDTHFSLVREPGIYWLGLLGFLSVLPEGAVIDWGALYFTSELGAPTVIAGYAFASLSLSTAIIRFLGDGLRNRFGSRKVARASCVLGAMGMLISGQADTVAVAMVGFFITGAGIANLIPIIMSASGKHPGVPASLGISTVGFMIMSGLMTAPAVIGYLSNFMSFSTVFTAMSLSFVFIFLRASVVDSADN